METGDSLVKNSLQSQQNQQSQLLRFFGGEKSGQKKEQEDALLQVATKRRADTVKFTHYFLKNRLSSEMESEISKHMKEHPAMKGNTFIGIITSMPFRTEVVDLKTASESTVDASPEEAMDYLKSNPVGYFNPEDFTLSTINEPAYKGLKERLDKFFENNSSIFQYLRENPENNVSLDDLYSPPKS